MRWAWRVTGLVGLVALSGCAGTTGSAFGPRTTVIDCETGYSEALVTGGKPQAEIERAFDRCLAHAIRTSGPPPETGRQVFIIRQSTPTVHVVPDGAGGYIAAPDQPSRRARPACPPGYRGLYGGTQFCAG